MILPLLLSTASLLLPSGGRTAPPARCTSPAMQFGGGAGKPPPEVMRCLALPIGVWVATRLAMMCVHSSVADAPVADRGRSDKGGLNRSCGLTLTLTLAR